ncbi:MAG: glycosyltransferase family 4 protein [Candidatus Aenigmatarchaeota archaeon]
MDKISILISAPLIAIGGITTHIFSLVNILGKHNFNIVIVGVTDLKQKDIEFLKHLNINILGVPYHANKYVNYFSKFNLIMKSYFRLFQKSFHIIYSNGWGNIHSYFKPFLREGGKFIFHQHGEHNINGFLKFHRTIESADIIIVNSETIADATKRDLSTNIPVYILPPLHGIKTHPTPPKDFPVHHTGILRVAYVGRLVPGKGIERLLEAWKLAGLEKAELHFYGCGDLEKDIVRFRERNKLNNIYLKGVFERSRLNEVFSNNDLIALFSDSEGVALSLIEGLAYGIPFVATKVGGIPYVASKLNGVILVDKTIESCAMGLKKMAELIKNNEIDRLSLYNYFCKEWAMEVLEKKWLEFFNTIL